MDPLAEIDARLEQARARLRAAEADLAAAQQELLEQQAARQTDLANYETISAVTINNTLRKLAEAEAWVARAIAEEESARAAFDYLSSYRDAIAQAMVDAIRRGVSPDEAFALAEAEVQNALTKQRVVRALIIMGAIMGGLGLLWLAWKAWRKARRK